MKNKDFDNLIAVLLKAKTKEEMKNLIEGILTPQEQVDIPQRLKIVELLKEGVPQHEIARRLGVGVATVTRGSIELRKGKFKYV